MPNSNHGKLWQTKELLIMGNCLLLIGLVIGCRPNPPVNSTPDSTQPQNTAPASTQEADPPASARPNQPSEPSGQQPTKLAPLKFNLNALPEQFEHRGRTYSKGQLHKNATIMMLAYEGDVRAELMVKNFLRYLNDDQSKQAKRLVRSHEEAFDKIRRARAKILEHASDDQNVQRLLFENQLDVADLMTKIRVEIRSKIMSEQQRQQLRKDNLAAQQELQ